jgi:hypothetical protein
MKSPEKFSLLRTVLKSIGLSGSAVEDIIDHIVEFLSGGSDQSSNQLEYPYCLRDDFLSPAEHSFLMVLRSAVENLVLVHAKVNLADLFYVRSNDPSKYRIYTNKIDRKHVDFLLCDPKTVRPIVGIELDDKSHQRSDRQSRDDFVENVFAAANLPLIRIPVRNSYSMSQLVSQLQPYLGGAKSLASGSQRPSREPSPRCGSNMVLRTARSGENEGDRFWGCPNFPKCRGIVKYTLAINP